MKTVFENDDGSINTAKLFLFFIFMGFISYASSLSWCNQPLKKSLTDYVLSTNKECPIQLNENLFLDSVSYDNDKLITQYTSGGLIKMDELEIDQLREDMILNTRIELKENTEFHQIVFNNDVKIKLQFINRNDRRQRFEFVIGREMLE